MFILSWLFVSYSPYELQSGHIDGHFLEEWFAQYGHVVQLHSHSHTDSFLKKCWWRPQTMALCPHCVLISLLILTTSRMWSYKVTR